MYQIGEFVLYGTQGVCSVTDITKKDFSGSEMNYYVLKPVYQQDSVYFVPVEGMPSSRVRKILTRDEADKLLEVLPLKSLLWVDNDTQRTKAYQDIINSGDRIKLLQLIETILTRRNEQTEKGKKLHQCDERILKTAVRIVHEELAQVFEMDPDDVGDYIQKRIEMKAIS
jgi:CarD family transcriptional regulator